MSERQEDNLERFFRSRLNEQSGSKDWNLPSEGLFYKAMSSIDVRDEPKKSKNRMWILLACLIGLIGVTSFFFTYQNNKLHSQLSSIESEIEKLNQEKSLLKNQNTEYASTIESLSKKNEALNEVIATSSEEKVENKLILEKASTKRIEDKNEFSYQEPNLSSSVRSGQVTIPNESLQFKDVEQGIENVNKEYLSAPLVSNNFNASSSVSTFGKNPFEIESIRILETSFFPIESSLIPFTNLASIGMQTKEIDNNYGFFLTAAYLQSSLDMKNIVGSNYTLTEYDSYYNGFDLGIHVEKKLTNRINILSGLNWTRINNHSLYQSDLVYDESNEYVSDNGNLIYRNSMDILSPIGSINMDDLVTMDKSISMENDDVMTNKTHINQTFDILALNIGANYTFLKSGKFSAQTGLSSSLNYILNAASNLNTSLYKDSDEMSNYTSYSDANQLNPLFISLTGSVGINYQLSNAVSFGLTGSYGRSLSSIKKTNTLDISKTYINSRSLAIGIGYEF